MMWYEHEYLVCVFVGNGKDVIERAKDIKRKTGVRPHIFADRFTLFQRLFFNCHTVKPQRTEFLRESLISFAREAEKYTFPVIVKCDDFSDAFVNSCDDIECYYLAVTC